MQLSPSFLNSLSVVLMFTSKSLKDIINSKNNNNNKMQMKKKIPKQFGENAMKTFVCQDDLTKIHLLTLHYYFQDFIQI